MINPVSSPPSSQAESVQSDALKAEPQPKANTPLPSDTVSLKSTVTATAADQVQQA